MNPVVHHLKISQSDRVVWILEEFGIDYELKIYERDSKSRLAPEELKKISPTKTAPLFEDTYQGKPIKLAETGAILDYVNTMYGKNKLSVKPGEEDYPQYLFWLHFSNASFNSVLMAKVALDYLDIAVETENAFLLDRLNDYLPMLEDQLKESPYVGGHKFTIADMLMFFPLTTMRVFIDYNLKPYPHILEYIKRIANRPAYQSYLEKADTGFKPPLT